MTMKLLLLSATARLAAAAPSKCALVKDKVVGAGHNFGPHTSAGSYAACCAICQKHAPECKAWTWHPPDSKKFPSMCLMHSEAGPTITEVCPAFSMFCC